MLTAPLVIGDKGFAYRLMLAGSDNLFYTCTRSFAFFFSDTQDKGCFIMQDASFNLEGVALPSKFDFVHVMYSTLMCENGSVFCTACTCQDRASSQRSMRQLKGFCKDQTKQTVERIIGSDHKGSCVHHWVAGINSI